MIGADNASVININANPNLTVLTTAPVADNPAWTADNTKYQLVYLTAEPATRYNGYIYNIQE